MRPELKTGVNVDPVNVNAGLRMAATLGYSDSQAQMVAEHSLLRWKRGEEESGEKLWLSEYPRDLTSWKAILAAAIVTPEPRSADLITCTGAASCIAPLHIHGCFADVEQGSCNLASEHVSVAPAEQA
ncbi:hypothetical protein SAMN06295974_3858 [Plantibacter flavus]|uniref:Uncharacterized protein n=1 Tax=Plantibacter flavus TaxID=150123 RepID=A0A3N2BL59_9MICO|nr:hypothetical protein [Plantibacter flavus]ROR75996.1 hypothetical protein EDD42_3948 [Plantibacter flavus]SMG49515.1 hypothetical protein SAMN06295974_3858 [Plantibacter flavus]